MPYADTPVHLAMMRRGALGGGVRDAPTEYPGLLPCKYLASTSDHCTGVLFRPLDLGHAPVPGGLQPLAKHVAASSR
eukprot:SAG11_NODE_1344_length_5148_cov_5.463260_2_plen_77_part_00